MTDRKPASKRKQRDFDIVIGSPDTVRDGFTQLAQATGADEFMLVSDVFDPALRQRSIGIAAGVVRGSAT